MLHKSLSIFFIFFLHVYTHAESITNISITGNNSISRGTILSYIGIESGDEISSEILQKTKEILESTDLFSTVNIALEDKKLIINLTENPTIKFFDVLGFKEDKVLSVQDVIKLQKNFNLTPGKVFVKSNLTNFSNFVKDLYQSSAHYDAKIKIKSSVDDKNRVSISVDIDEGDRALIGKFSISGNNFFDQDSLIELFDMGESDFFIINYFTEKDHFDRKKFDSGVQKLRNRYLSEGFLDMSIEKSTIALNKNTNKLEINIIIFEGMQYKVGEVRISGDTLGISHKDLLSLIGLSSGDPFKRSQIIKGIQNIEKIYKDKGYAFSNVSSDTKKIGNETLDILLNLSHEELIYIKRINISGNTRTQDDVIRRKFNINEGGVYSKKEIDDSIRAIKRLGFFSDVKFDLKRRLKDSDQVDIFITVEETKTGEMSIGLSHSNASGAAINAGISQKNILGTGNTLNANLTNSSAVDEVSFYFKDPNFGEKDNHSISYGFFNKTLDASNIDASSYTLDESGLILGYGLPVSGVSEVFLETRISSIDLFCGDDLKNTHEISDCASKDKLDIPISFTYSSNSLNDSFFPTDGKLSTITSVITTPLSDFKYIKFESNFKKYTPIFSDKTLKISNRINYATGYGGDKLPFFKRYYEGGSSSVRGFDFNSLGAKYSNDKPKGGEFSFVSSLGLGAPASIIGMDNENIRLIAFIDAGAISETVENISFSDVRSSLGFQLSWLTPIGPLGLHLAQPILKKTGDNSKTFSFDLGSTF